MRNVHILPTDKPSRLHYYYHFDGIEYYGLSKEVLQWKQGRNLYITSDEEIKDCYVITDLDKIIKVDKSNEDFYHLFNCKKIILTTDQDLIKDGVQDIPDEFLEWFIKNSTCEEISIQDAYKVFLNGDKRSISNFRNRYKIEIPRENKKQQIIDIMKADEEIGLYETEEKYTQKDMEEAFNTGFRVGYYDEVSPSYLTFEEWIKNYK